MYFLDDEKNNVVNGKIVLESFDISEIEELIERKERLGRYQKVRRHCFNDVELRDIVKEMMEVEEDVYMDEVSGFLERIGKEIKKI